MTASGLLHAYFRRRYAVLFYTLILVLGVGPLLSTLGFDQNWMRIFLELNLFVAVFGFPLTRRSAALRLGLALALVARLLAFAVEGQTVNLATRPLVIAVAFLAAIGALRFALRSRHVDTEHVYAALDAYVLIGIFAGLLHHLIEETWPGSYVSGGAALPEFSLLTAMYFSFVTLATLGYGDIVPQSDVARGFTVVEAIVGQLYLAVLIARLVSNAAVSFTEDGSAT